MSLRAQLLTLGLLTIVVLPWAGVRFVEQMEAALRGGLEASLATSARSVASALVAELGSSSASVFEHGSGRSGPEIYAQALASSPALDGRRDDWRPSESLDIELGAGHEASAGTYGRFAYVFVAVADTDLVAPSGPGRTPYGDRVALYLEPAAEPPLWLLLSTGAQGVFRAEHTAAGAFAPTGRVEERVLAAWRAVAGGYALEARIPLALVERGFGIAVIDVDVAPGGHAVELAASFDSQGTRASAFVHRRAGVERVLERFARAGDRFRVFDDAGWIVADTGAVAPLAARSTNPDPTERLLRRLLRREDPRYVELEAPRGRLAAEGLQGALEGRDAIAWYQDGPGEGAIVAVAVPVGSADRVVGAVVLEQASDPILTIANQALLKLMLFTLAAAAALALMLLAYATFLSARVRRLARAAEHALGPKGEINALLPGHAARDEIGDLSRAFANLLKRLSEYTQYLQTLKGKLAHELRTPLAIVSTSLDNLEHEARGPEVVPYLERLRAGATRLDSILAAMSDATRIEQAVADTPVEEFDLAAVVGGCATAYAGVYPGRRIVHAAPGVACKVRGSADLVAQLLDKLVDNAVSFSPAESTIEIGLAATPAGLVLSVRNEGPPLPEPMRDQLFDSLVSIRAHKDGRTHLGLGLYIVALIARFHGAEVGADNAEDGTGAVFRVVFPRA